MNFAVLFVFIWSVSFLFFFTSLLSRILHCLQERYHGLSLTFHIWQIVCDCVIRWPCWCVMSVSLCLCVYLCVCALVCVYQRHTIDCFATPSFPFVIVSFEHLYIISAVHETIRQTPPTYAFRPGGVVCVYMYVRKHMSLGDDVHFGLMAERFSPTGFCLWMENFVTKIGEIQWRDGEMIRAMME